MKLHRMQRVWLATVFATEVIALMTTETIAQGIIIFSFGLAAACSAFAGFYYNKEDVHYE